MKDSISIENHGVTLGISKGINTGVTITSNGKMMNAQLEAHQCAEIAEFLNIYPKEIKRLKRINLGLVDRNEELRGYIISLIQNIEAFESDPLNTKLAKEMLWQKDRIKSIINSRS